MNQHLSTTTSTHDPRTLLGEGLGIHPRLPGHSLNLVTCQSVTCSEPARGGIDNLIVDIVDTTCHSVSIGPAALAMCYAS